MVFSYWSKKKTTMFGSKTVASCHGTGYCSQPLPPARNREVDMALTRSASKLPLRERSPPVSPSQSISPARKKLSAAPAAEESASPTTEKMFATILERLESLTTSQHNIVSRLTDIERQQDETTRLVQSAVETAEKASDTASQLKAEVSVLEEEIKRVQRDTKSTMARLQTDILKETADRISREANVILIGLDEPVTDTDQTAIKTNLVQFAKKEMALEMKEEDIVQTRRLGKQGGDDGKPRHRPLPLLVKFRTAHAKKEFEVFIPCSHLQTHFSSPSNRQDPGQHPKPSAS